MSITYGFSQNLPQLHPKTTLNVLTLQPDEIEQNYLPLSKDRAEQSSDQINFIFVKRQTELSSPSQSFSQL